VQQIPEASTSIASVVAVVLPFVLWIAWWLWCVDWRKLWPTLGSGAWAPAVLLVAMGGVVWGRLDPRDLTWPGFYVPSMAWHVLAAICLGCLAMICGWLQGVFGWVPPEFPVHPPALAHGHGHSDGHGHH
jgi:hypothetical protein